MTATTRISARRAKQLIEAADLVKAPDWRESHCWHVVADGETLVVVEPAYRAGTRRGWSYHLAALSPPGRPAAAPSSPGSAGPPRAPPA